MDERFLWKSGDLIFYKPDHDPTEEEKQIALTAIEKFRDKLKERRNDTK
jgi:hypothetical protein